MIRSIFFIFSFFLCASLLTACDEKTQTPANQTNAAGISLEKVIDEWVGQWNGPEGTYLILSKSGEGYNIRIKDLDGEKSYLGVINGRSINFHRDDHQETLYFNNGRETGMKWLADYNECLMTKYGEGWCRDYNPAKPKATSPADTKPQAQTTPAP